MNENLETIDGLCEKIIEQRIRIEVLEAALREIAGDQTSWRAQRIARAALDKDAGK
jgi:hypothetical protein